MSYYYNDIVVFISHSSLDKHKAAIVFNFLQSLGITTYIDAIDSSLQSASKVGDSKKVVECIEKGIDSCSHLLGVITENTKNSWWVSYEIGIARAYQRECGHLVAKEVKYIPDFITIGTLFTYAEEIINWLGISSYVERRILLEKRASTHIDSYFQKHKLFLEY